MPNLLFSFPGTLNCCEIGLDFGFASSVTDVANGSDSDLDVSAAIVTSKEG